MHIMCNGLARLAAASCLALLTIGNVNADPRSPPREVRQNTKQIPTPQDISEICLTFRHDWGNISNGVWDMQLDDTAGFINGTSRVFVAIGEGTDAGKALGDARFTLYDVAPRSGGVDIRVDIAAASSPRVSVDYLVCNP